MSAESADLFMERPRLYALLDSALAYPVVVLAAGPGYGKTVFLRRYLAKRQVEGTIQIDLQEGDNEAAFFWRTFRSGLTVLDPRTARELGRIGFPASEEAFDSVILVLAGMVAAGKMRLLCLDNFQIIRSPAVRQFIFQLGLAQLDNFRVIIMTREKNKLGQTISRYKRLMFFITDRDLAFTVQEIAAYLQRIPYCPTDAELKRIEAWTEGWGQALACIAVEMSAAGLKDGPLPEQLCAAARKRWENYLDTCVLPEYNVRLSAVLTKLALLGEAPSALLGRLFQLSGAEVDMLLDDHFVRKDILQETYAIQPFFRSYWQKKALRLPFSERFEVHNKAAGWCEEKKRPLEALYHYEQTGQYGELVRVLETAADFPNYAVSEYLTIVRSAARTPIEYWLSRDKAQAVYATALLRTGRPQACLTFLRQMEDGEASDPQRKEKLARRHILRAAAGLSSPSEMLESVHNACAYLQQNDRLEDALRQESFSMFGSPSLLQRYYQKAGLDQVRQAFQEVLNYWRQLNDRFGWGADDLLQAEIYYEQGYLPEASLFISRMAAKTSLNRNNSLEMAKVFLQMKIILAEGNGQACQKLLHSLQSLRAGVGDALTAAAADTIIDYACTLQEVAGAGSSSAWDSGSQQEYCFRVYLRRGLSPQFGERFGLPENGVQQIITGRILLYKGEYERLWIFCGEQAGQPPLLLRVHLAILAALAAYKLERKTEALQCLKLAYKLSLPDNLFMPFVEYGKAMVTLLQGLVNAVETSIPALWRRTVLARAQKYAAGVWRQKVDLGTKAPPSKASPVDPEAALTSRLSQREKEALILMAQGHCAKEIAHRMGIKVTTVKTLTKRIYTKLEVNNKTGAVRLAYVGQLMS